MKIPRIKPKYGFILIWLGLTLVSIGAMTSWTSGGLVGKHWDFGEPPFFEKFLWTNQINFALVGVILGVLPQLE